MERVHADKLYAVRKRMGRPFPVRDAINIAIELLDGLDVAHNPPHEMVHRDIKPGNVFTARISAHETRAVQLDFGVARLLAKGNQRGDVAVRISRAADSLWGSQVSHTDPRAPLSSDPRRATEPMPQPGFVEVQPRVASTGLRVGWAANEARRPRFRSELAPHAQSVNSFFVPHSLGTTMRLALVLAITLCAGSAIAQPKDNKAESDKAFFEGLKLVESKDYVGARAKFADAYAKFPSPNSLLNMASTEQLLGQCIDALGHFKAYLALPENPRITPDRKELARQGIASCTSLVARINVKAPTGTAVSVDGANVKWVEGDAIDVLPGKHTVDLKQGTETKTRKVDSAAGIVGFVEWDDPAATHEPAIPRQNDHGVDPTTAPSMATTTPVNNTPKWIAGGTLAGVGVVGLVVGGVFYGLNQSAKSDVDSKAANGACINPMSSSCADLANSRDQVNTDKTLSTIGFISGGVLLAGGVAVLVWAALSLKTTLRTSSALVPYFVGTSLGLKGEF